jgi:hypothetical protein
MLGISLDEHGAAGRNKQADQVVLTRRRIVAAARAVLVGEDCQRLSLDAVASEAGISQTALIEAVVDLDLVAPRQDGVG